MLISSLLCTLRIPLHDLFHMAQVLPAHSSNKGTVKKLSLKKNIRSKHSLFLNLIWKQSERLKLRTI